MNPYIPLKNYNIAKQNMIELYDKFSDKLHIILSIFSTGFGSVRLGLLASAILLPVNSLTLKIFSLFISSLFI